MIEIKFFKKSKAAAGGFFTKSLNKYLKRKAEASIRPRKKVIRPSELGYCERKIVMSILNIYTEPPVNPRVQRIFDNGHKIHTRYLRQYLDKMIEVEGIAIEQKIEVPDLWLKGSPDAIIKDMETGKHYIFELKSIKSSDFEILNKPMEVHEVQTRIYMFMAGVKQAVIFYENKDSQETKEFHLEYDEEKEKAILDKCRRIINYVENYETTQNLPEECIDRRCRACHK